MKNYRPIALLQVFYKFLANLLSARFIAAYDNWLQSTQFGFRPKRSTTQTIFIARRIQNISKRQQSNMLLVLLDWEKAFGKINHDKLRQILRRLKTPPKMLRIVAAMYNDLNFRIAHDGSYSAYRVQNAGIRQGCPLSPYLFSMLMSGMFFNIKQQLNTPKQIEQIKGIRSAEVLYADSYPINKQTTSHYPTGINILQYET